MWPVMQFADSHTSAAGGSDDPTYPALEGMLVRGVGDDPTERSGKGRRVGRHHPKQSWANRRVGGRRRGGLGRFLQRRSPEASGSWSGVGWNARGCRLHVPTRWKPSTSGFWLVSQEEPRASVSMIATSSGRLRLIVSAASASLTYSAASAAPSITNAAERSPIR